MTFILIYQFTSLLSLRFGTLILFFLLCALSSSLLSVRGNWFQQRVILAVGRGSKGPLNCIRT